MSTEPDSTEDSVELERRLLDLVPSGESVGNITLLDQLQWPEATYWRVRNRLIDSGRLTKGRGRGGSVRKVTQPTTTATRLESESRTTETDLYAPVLKTIKSHWVKDYRIRDFVAEITAYQGRRETGGKWSRPDITLAS
jgi:hypothetical protein